MVEAIEKAAFRVEPGEAGLRLDAFLARKDAKLSRSRYQALIKAGHVTLDGLAIRDPSRKVLDGELFQVALPPPEKAAPEPEKIALHILYEDKDVIAIDKPAGLVVHPGAGNPKGTLVNALLAHCGESLSGIGGVARPGIVHRLDRDTSGVLVAAKNDAAHRSLSAQFAAHGRDGVLLRQYDALVWGVPNPHFGLVDLPLKRDPKNRQKQQVARSGGRPALTHYRVREKFAGVASLLTCRLETGRTHQIRVHLAHIGHPLIGDRVYGAGYLTKAHTLPGELKTRVKTFGRQALHARLLRFAHPRSGKPLQFETNWPPDMADLVERFRKLPV
jgi:23S rRNA pseudouridine1911/1915/1917 synthase